MKMKIKYSVNNILSLILIFIMALFVISTIAVFALGKAQPGKNKKNAENIEISETNRTVEMQKIKDDKNLKNYTAIGRIRALTKNTKTDEIGTIVIITPWFSYPKNDNEFFEEISKKNMAIKTLFIKYFSSFTLQELKTKGEEKIKAELLKELNEMLVLNKVQALYFSEFIFME